VAFLYPWNWERGHLDASTEGVALQTEQPRQDAPHRLPATVAGIIEFRHIEWAHWLTRVPAERAAQTRPGLLLRGVPPMGQRPCFNPQHARPVPLVAIASAGGGVTNQTGADRAIERLPADARVRGAGLGGR